MQIEFRTFVASLVFTIVRHVLKINGTNANIKIGQKGKDFDVLDNEAACISNLS
jgi:hypothetical protein